MAIVAALTAGVEAQSRFFFGMSVALLLILLVGFAPTLYLRPFFDVAPIPLYLYIHGAVLTGWFLFLCLQTSLIAAGRHDLHRRLGIVGAFSTLLVIIASLMAGLLKASRLNAMGVDLAARIGRDSGIFWSNAGSLLIFLTFVLAAVVLRHRTEAHKRLMLLGSINIMGPPFGRIARWPIFDGSGADAWLERSFSIGGILLLMLVLLGYDLSVRRRLHPATLIGCAGIILVRIASITIASTETGQAIVLGTATLM